MPVITVEHVTKVYRRYGRRKQFATLKSALLDGSLITDLKPDETFTALGGVSFSVAKGATFGIVGRNGSGKSTMLKLVAGITKPTSGRVTVQGRVSALIELGAGFHPEISGRENVFINGIMLGLSKKEITRRFDEIVEFAELQDFIDAPVKTYSSGMYMRLGFAVAIHVDPEVLLIDEVLAVGDEAFAHKCLDKFGEFRRRGKTILIVTHSLGLVERLCDDALWLHDGCARAQGDPLRVVGAYLIDVGQSEEHSLAAVDARAQAQAATQSTPSTPPDARGDGFGAQEGGADQPEAEHGPGRAIEPAGAGAPDDRDATPPDSGPDPSTPPEDMFKAREGRWGSREVEIVTVVLKDQSGQAGHVFQSGDPLAVHLSVRAAQPVDDFAFGIGLFNTEGVCCYGTNTHIEEMEPASLHGESEVVFNIDALELVEGTYKLDVAVHKRDGYPYDYHRLLHTFRVKSRARDVGIYRPRHHWAFSGNVEFKAAGSRQQPDGSEP